MLFRSNLLDNAIRYTPEHGRIAIQVRTEVKSRSHYAVLEIEDSGPGIAMSERDKVFEPFYRAASSSQINPGGAGLGLSIVRDIVALHQGQLRLDDGTQGAAQGVGLRLTVMMPLYIAS